MDYTELTPNHQRSILRQRLLELEAEHFKTTQNLRDAIPLNPDLVPQLKAKLDVLDGQHERALAELEDLPAPSPEEPGED